MQIPSRPILRLLQRRSVAPSPVFPMHRIPPPSRSLLSSMASGPSRGWLPTLAGRVALVRAALNHPVHHVSRLPHGSRNMAVSSGVKGQELGRSDRRRLTPSSNNPMQAAKNIAISVDKWFPITRGMDSENRAAIEEFIARYGNVHPAHIEEYGAKNVDAMYDEDVCSTAVESVELTNGKQDPKGAAKDLTGRKEDAKGQRTSMASDEDEYGEVTSYQDGYSGDDVGRALVLPESSHRDCSIYKDNYHWKKEFCIANRNETRLEAMMLSDPSKDRILKGGARIRHKPCSMWQIFSLKVAKIPVDSGSVELYGYIAARDLIDPLLNYVVNVSRDDPIVVEQGSLIEMTGPKRGIELSRTVLLEYDMRIKTGDKEKDDLQLIDGVSIIDELITWCEPVTQRIHGNYGAIGMTQLCLENAVEATVEVVVSKVQSSFDLCLSCFTSGLQEEIRLFDGVVGESRGLKRHVLAVMIGTCMDLKFKVGSGSDRYAEHCHSFKATNHGCASQQLNTEFAAISVKVTWSTLDLKMMELL